MDTIQYFKEQFDKQPATVDHAHIQQLRSTAFADFSKSGIPSVKNEEWKYTRINDFFTKEYQYNSGTAITAADLAAIRLPNIDKANELVFVNGIYDATLSVVLSEGLLVQPLQEAAGNEFAEVVAANLGHSVAYHPDGINALNTAFAQDGIFINVKKCAFIDAPVVIYNLTDARTHNILAQPRILVNVEANAQVTFAELYHTIGSNESFTNQVIELVVAQDAITNYYKIQNDTATSTLVSTTHVHQTGTSTTNVVTVSLSGNIIRNNLNMVMSAPHCNANMFGLYLQQGETHVDNHTIVDNREPHCLSTELYKGVLSGNATGVFNGKIFVRQIAQKTNAYQSNRNILLSEGASVNTKPQLEIFADDVKCSHGCTVGRLDNDALFYMRSRGISEKTATTLLLHGYAFDIIEKIANDPIRNYVEQLVNERLATI